MRTLGNILSRPNGLIGGILCLIVFGCALTGLFWTPHNPLGVNFGLRFAPPSASNLLGTDMFGRDLLSRVLAGASTSMVICFVTVALAMVTGGVLGALCGFVGGWIDRAVMMFVEAVMAFPSILFALSLMVIMGPSEYGVVIALAIAYMPSVVRLMRGTVMSVREKEYVEASVALGNSAAYTLVRHIVPNSLTPLIVLATTMLGGVLLSESALSFLGLGVPPPAPTWGNMLAEARPELARQPWLGILPGICISITLVGVNLLGDALRDALDPRNTRLIGGNA